MSFREQYAALECKFKEQVVKDNEDFGIESCFLANVAPKAQVDYVLVAMEPSRPANIDSIKNSEEPRRPSRLSRYLGLEDHIAAADASYRFQAAADWSTSCFPISYKISRVSSSTLTN